MPQTLEHAGGRGELSVPPRGLPSPPRGQESRPLGEQVCEGDGAASPPGSCQTQRLGAPARLRFRLLKKDTQPQVGHCRRRPGV